MLKQMTFGQQQGGGGQQSGGPKPTVPVLRAVNRINELMMPPLGKGVAGKMNCFEANRW
jgi:hypothetical protein